MNREIKTKVKVQLLSCTTLPMETVYCVWMRSRDPNFKLTPAEVSLVLEDDSVAPEYMDNLTSVGRERLAKKMALMEDVNKIFHDLIDTHLPLAEMIDFVFWIDDCPIALREQLVRHRIGVKINGVPDVDVIPDPMETWWAQGMRIMDMATFWKEGRYYTPESIARDPYATEVYESALKHAQDSYGALAQMGIPREDARGVIPMHANHGLAWKLNLQALKHIIGHRACWILQIGMWEALLRGMVDELATKVHPHFRTLMNPPCMKGDEFVGCVFAIDNERRIEGSDEPPPCSLFMNKHADIAEAMARKYGNSMWVIHNIQDETHIHCNDDNRAKRYLEQREKFKNLWQRDPDTAIPLFPKGVIDPKSM